MRETGPQLIRLVYDSVDLSSVDFPAKDSEGDSPISITPDDTERANHAFEEGEFSVKPPETARPALRSIIFEALARVRISYQRERPSSN